MSPRSEASQCCWIRARISASLSLALLTPSASLLPDELVAEENEAVADGLGLDEAHGRLVAGLAEQALASPEHDREDDEPHLVDEVVLDEGAPELIAGRDDDLSVQLPLELRDLGHHVAPEGCRVVPVGIHEGG